MLHLPWRVCQTPTHLKQYVVESTGGQQDIEGKTECKWLFFSTLDNVIGELNRRFNERNSQLVEALCALDQDSPHFLDEQKAKPLLELTNTAFVESEFSIAHQFLQSEMAHSAGDLWTPTAILQRFSGPHTAMPTVLTPLKHGVTFGASSATCKSTSSTLTNVQLAQAKHVAPEKSLLDPAGISGGSHKALFQGKDWKERLFKKFSNQTRRPQLWHIIAPHCFIKQGVCVIPFLLAFGFL